MHSHRTQNRDRALCGPREPRESHGTRGARGNKLFFFAKPPRLCVAAKPCCGTRARSSPATSARRSILGSVERTKPTSSSQHYQTRPKRREGRIRARPPAALPSANDVRRYLGRVFTGAGGAASPRGHLPAGREILIFVISKKQICKNVIRPTFHRPS
jgi:hypothetical protein